MGQLKAGSVRCACVLGRGLLLLVGQALRGAARAGAGRGLARGRRLQGKKAVAAHMALHGVRGGGI